jgi:iron(III) transport system substrate-binding protein
MLRPARASTPTPLPTGEPSDRLLVYSGRSDYFQTIVDAFSEATGIAVDVRYGDGATLAATIVEEGENSPADVFLAIDESSIGALKGGGYLQPLPQSVLDRVEPAYRDPDGTWIGTTARARVLAYNPTLLDGRTLPRSIRGLVEPRFRGKIGWAPDTAPFLAFVTAFRVVEGEVAARAWLAGMLANGVVRLDGNSVVMKAVADGELGAGLVNHYYAFEYARERGDDSPIVNHYFDRGDIGALVTVAAAAMLARSTHTREAAAFIDWSLQTDAQRFLADERFEYPLATGVPANAALPELASIAGPEVAPEDIADLQGSVKLLTDLGIL